VPFSVESNKSSQQVSSLLSRTPDSSDANHKRLELAGVVRSALVATDHLIVSTIRHSSSSTRATMDGMPLSLKSAKRVMKYYKVEVL